MSLPKAFTQDMDDDERELMKLLASVVDAETDRQRARSFDREPLDNLIEGPFPGTGLVDMNAVVAEQSQLKEDFKKLHATNSALYAALIHFAVKIKTLEKKLETRKR